MVTVAVPLVVDPLRAMGEPLTAQVGRSMAPLGEVAKAHERSMLPVYPLDPLTVMVVVMGVPGAAVAGDEDVVDDVAVNADMETATVAVPVAAV